jgi:hypothetical protein
MVVKPIMGPEMAVKMTPKMGMAAIMRRCGKGNQGQNGCGNETL